MEQNLVKISKFLSYVLRHKPDAIGLTLDPEGWADIDELIVKADVPIDHALLKQAVAQNDKKRFALSPDGRSIRANQGHSIKVDLGLTPTEPPETLFHGTADRFLESILDQGLTPQNRQYVHLSQDRTTAKSVGSRHGKPVILTLPARVMHDTGHQFYLAKNDVWLTDHVPARHLSLLKN